MPWTRHIRTCCELIGRAFDAAQKTGDLVYAGICSGLRVLNFLRSVMRLPTSNVKLRGYT